MPVVPKQLTTPGQPAGGSADSERVSAGPLCRAELEEMYASHRQGFFTLALAITQDRGRAEDAVHEAFARLCKQDRDVEGDRLAYVYVAVRNAATDERRRRGRRSQHSTSIFAEPASLVSSDDDPQLQVSGQERRQLLREAVQGLPDQARQTVALRVFVGLTFEQVAEVMDEPLGTVTSRYHRALQQLRRKVEHLR